MAFVGISANLTSAVRNQIHTMRNAELNATIGETTSRIPITVTGNERWFIEKVWLNKLNLLSEIPSEWLAKFEAVDFHFSGPDFKLDCRAEGNFKLPPIYRGSYPDVYVTFNVGDDMPVDIINEHIIKAKQRSEILQRWEKVAKQVYDFLDNCKSLNEALKLWPDLKLYIPNEFIARVERKAAKAEKSESSAASILAGINTEEIHAAAVIARMSGANV